MKNFENRISELLAKMTLDQKVGQIVQPERQFVTPEEVKKYHIGSVLSGGGSVPGENKPEDWIKMNDEYWAASMEEDEDHLAIPLIYGVDAIHGNTNVLGAVVFPHNIGLGAAHDPDLLERVASTTAKEIAAIGVEWTFAPTLAVARNDHWGRTYESYSEDPKIVSEYAPRFVMGLQGNYTEENVIACAKHFIGDGATLHGIDQGDMCISEEELRKLHVPPYKAAIDAGVLTVMVSLSSWFGEKCHGHKFLLTDLLKNELGFNGFVISDWDGIDYLDESYEESSVMALNAGMDMFMITGKWKEFIDHIKKNVQNGRIPMERLDDAVRRILRVKFEFGMFQKPRPSERKLSQDTSCFGSEEHREVAREAVRKSMVMLKNEDDILPLKKDAKILVAGKNAHNRGYQCGGFTVAWQGVDDADESKDQSYIMSDSEKEKLRDKKVKKETPHRSSIIGGTSIWEGIQRVAPNAELNVDGLNADPEKHEVAIVCIGEIPYAEMLGDIRIEGLAKGLKISKGSTADETYDKDDATIMKEGPYGTHLYLHELHPEDLETIRNITSKGIPVVAVMICGRPLVIEQELAETKAFVVAWFPGSEGQGVADVLFGDYPIQGKLSFSWPRYDDENWNLGDEGYNPMFPYGFGLEYKK
ncbi:MAG: glycoside hydrolase family 3 protein [Candidatus Cloacimonetes bacterium]|nr:glycoside hydrolase family 3 protein [Candidatus Cloacimonadota bacterium]MCF7869397.1 glycoside hydrolase family 3 protein [Candidatus Cloacimonadota bacterium]